MNEPALIPFRPWLEDCFLERRAAGLVLVCSFVLLRLDVVATVLVQLERQDGHLGIREGASLLRRHSLTRHRPDPCNNVSHV